jgi:hypothetical protein
MSQSILASYNNLVDKHMNSKQGVSLRLGILLALRYQYNLDGLNAAYADVVLEGTSSAHVGQWIDAYREPIVLPGLDLRSETDAKW